MLNPKDLHNSILLTRDKMYENYVGFKNTIAPYMLFAYAVIGEVYISIKELFRK